MAARTVQRMGNEQLRFMAAKLVSATRNNAGTHWWLFEQRRRKVRTTIRRILRENGYPPDMQDEAMRTVVLQAEMPANQTR